MENAKVVVPNGKFKLYYLDINGRGIAIRVALKIAGFEFDDVMLSFGDLFKKRIGKDGISNYNENIPLGTLPILVFPDGKTMISQSSAIARFAGKYCGLYPHDPFKAILVDDIIDTCSDFITLAPKHTSNEIKKELREKYSSEQLPKYFGYISQRLKQSGGPFILGNEISIGDLVLFGMIDLIVSGELDYVPVKVLYPWKNILDHYELVKNHHLITETKSFISKL